MKKVLFLALCVATSLFAQNTEEVAYRSNGSRESNGSTIQRGERPQSGSIKWYTNFDEASSLAARQKKPILLYFTGSDWCGWCKKLDQEVFSTSDFAQAMQDRFVFVKLDFPMNSRLPENEMRQNAQLKQKYGVTGYPTVVLVDHDGRFIGETGYRSGGGKAYAQWLEQFFVQ